MRSTDKILSKLALVLAVSLLPLVAVPAAAETNLRVTLDTPPTHVRNQAIKAFAAELKERSGGALTAEVFDSGQLYSSRDAGKAVARGDVDLAIVSSVALSRGEADLNALDLPMFSGMTPARKHQVVDGPLGQALSAKIEKKFGVIVPGRWYVLGALNTYSTGKPVNSFADIAGLKVRVPGGAVLPARFRVLGANPVTMPFPDVPLALQQGVVDAIVSSNLSIISAKLTDTGIRHAFVDNIMVGYYVPIVSTRYWSKLDTTQQKLFRDLWNKYADRERAAAIEDQGAARKKLEAKGVTFVEPDAAALDQVRVRLVAEQPALVKTLNISQPIMVLAERAAK